MQQFIGFFVVAFGIVVIIEGSIWGGIITIGIGLYLAFQGFPFLMIWTDDNNDNDCDSSD